MPLLGVQACADADAETAALRQAFYTAQAALDALLDDSPASAAVSIDIAEVPDTGAPETLTLIIGDVALLATVDWTIPASPTPATLASAIAAAPGLNAIVGIQVSVEGASVSLAATTLESPLTIVLGSGWDGFAAASAAELLPVASEPRGATLAQAASAGSEALADTEALVFGITTLAALGTQAGLVTPNMTSGERAEVVSRSLEDLAVVQGKVIRTDGIAQFEGFDVLARLLGVQDARSFLGSIAAGGVAIVATVVQVTEKAVTTGCGTFLQTSSEERVIGTRGGPQDFPSATRFYCFWKGTPRPAPSVVRQLQRFGFDTEQRAAILTKEAHPSIVRVVIQYPDALHEALSTAQPELVAELLSRGILTADLTPIDGRTLDGMLTGEPADALAVVVETEFGSLFPEFPTSKTCDLGRFTNAIEAIEGLTALLLRMAEQIQARLGRVVMDVHQKLKALQEFAAGFPPPIVQCAAGVGGLVSRTPGVTIPTPTIPGLPRYTLEAESLDTLEGKIQQFVQYVYNMQDTVREGLLVLEEPACALLGVLDTLLGSRTTSLLDCVEVPVPPFTGETLGDLSIGQPPCMREVLELNREVVLRAQRLLTVNGAVLTDAQALAYGLDSKTIALGVAAARPVRSCEPSHATRIAKYIQSL